MRESVFRKQFGRAVKAAREEHGQTQRELAEAAGIAEKYLSRVELGMATPSVHVAVRLAEALGIGVEVLVGDAPKRPPAAFSAVVRLLRDRTPEEIERVRRVIAELLR